MTQLAIEQAMEIALGHHRAGRFAQAEEVYRQVLAQESAHAGALHLLGVLSGQTGRTSAAIELITRAIAVDPAVAEYHIDLGESYRMAGDLDASTASFHRALALKPDVAITHNNLGNVLVAQGRTDEALVAFQRATELKPDHAAAFNSLGSALLALGRANDAITAFSRAVALRPDDAEFQENLGIALSEMGWHDASIAAYNRASQLKPDDSRVHSNLGIALHLAGRTDEAVAAFHRAIELQPESAAVHNNLGVALRDATRLDEALSEFDRAIAIKPDYAEAHNNLANVLKDQGRLDDALAAFRRSVALKPDSTWAASNVLFTLHYHPDVEAQQILAEHRRWAERFADPLAAEIRPLANDRSPDRRLRIGFLSPDFRDHPVARSLIPLFQHRDRREVEVVGYSDVLVLDRLTEQVRALADDWHTTVGLSDAQLAERIRADRIDILVDTTLHTANNRLLVFARKPAPVQVTMLGPPVTTGLSTMDFRLTDPYLDPPGSGDADYTEQSVRLPHCFWVFPAPEPSPPVSALPASGNGFVTFGCLNQPAKVSRPALDLWLKVLQALPGSRLGH